MSPVAAQQPLKVFISYSRRDVETANRLKDTLESHGFQVLMDLRNLPYGEDWQRELEDLIRQSDTVIWLLSPTSITSDYCNWEVGVVTSIRKRLIPVRIAAIEVAALPKAIGKVHILPAEGVFDFSEHIDVLVPALRADQAWLKDGTRLADRARQWVAKNRDGALLLRGAALRDAEQWSRDQPREAPAPPGDVLELILASRQSQSRRQRYFVAGSLVLAVLMAGLAGYAWVQNLAAEASRRETQTTLATSDFRQGTQSIEKAETHPEGLALLARAVKTNNDQRAAARLWAHFQQNAIWVPAGAPSEARPREQTARGVPADIAKRFEKVVADGKPQEVTSLSVSRDLGAVFTAIGSVVDGTDVRVRVWDRQGRPKTPWITPEYDGEHYLSAARGHLSPDGRYLALEVQGWREAASLVIYDVAKGTRIGGRIEMTGQRPETQNIEFTHVEFIAPPERDDASGSIKWYLLLGAYKGDASVQVLEETRHWRWGVNQHRDEVVFAAFDAKRDWLVSAGADATVKVSNAGGPLGQTLVLDYPARVVTIRGRNKLTVIDSRSMQQDFELMLPGVQRVSAAERTADQTTACFELPFSDDATGKEELAKFRGSAMADAEIVGNREVRIKPIGSEGAGVIVFAADIKLVCALNGGAQFAFSLEGFRTELWDKDLKRRLGSPINEWMLFTGREHETPQKTTEVTLSKDRSRASVRSHLWIPPNLAMYWVSVWDVVSGMPLTGRQRYSPGEGTDDVRFAESGEKLLLFRTKNDDGQPARAPDHAIDLDHSRADNVRIAELAEAVGGTTYDASGLPVVVTDRHQRIANGTRYLREKLPVVEPGALEQAAAQPTAPAVPAPSVVPGNTERTADKTAMVQSPVGSASEAIGPEQALSRRLTQYVQDVFLKDMESYAARVDYYDRGIVSRESVLQDKAGYARRWPQRVYQLVPGSLVVVSASDTRVTLSFSYRFSVANGPRSSSGQGTTTLQLQTTAGQFEVVGVKERVQR